MAKKKPIPTCNFKGCKRNCRTTKKNSWNRFCCVHGGKVTINAFLGGTYTRMNQRVRGKNTKSPHLYLGLPILPKDVFMNWATNHPDFLRLYKRWFTNNFDMKLTPSVNRMNSSRGYVLGNMEWLTHSQNSGLSSEVVKMKNRKAIYELLGVNK